jgi:hypothetical protein
MVAVGAGGGPPPDTCCCTSGRDLPSPGSCSKTEGRNPPSLIMMVGHETEIRRLWGLAGRVRSATSSRWWPGEGEIGSYRRWLDGRGRFDASMRRCPDCTERKWEVREQETGKSREGERVQRKVKRGRKKVDPTKNLTWSDHSLESKRMNARPNGIGGTSGSFRP